jgi:O-antigen/teichoic acid export membrane protein
LPQAISAGLNVLLNLWAIPRFGLPGVAAVYGASELILAAGYGGLILLWLRDLPQHEKISS